MAECYHLNLGKAMNNTKWDVRLMLPDKTETFSLCKCESIEKLNEVIRILFERGPDGPDKIIIEVRES
jgi:hypothetical protein